MPICASCGQPVDAARAQRNACPSCTWRAALRLSKTSTTDEAETAADPISSSLDSDDADIELSDDPVALVSRLQDLAAATSDQVDDHRARRIYVALLNGNTRPYEAEMNRLVSRFIDSIEHTWNV